MASIFEGESFITVIITCFAAIIPIVFSVSTLAIQYTASTYTASLLEYYKKDAKTWFFYGFLSFGLLFASLVLFARSGTLLFANGSRVSLLNAVLLMFSFSFVLLPFHLTHVANLVDPRGLIVRARDQCIREIHSVSKSVESAIGKMKTRTEAERRIAELPLFPQIYFHANAGDLLAAPRRDILQILDIVLKSAVRREAETYEFGFEAISKIAQTYVSIRKDDSTSDDEFLRYIYDQLMSIPKMALDTENVTLLQAVIATLENIGCSAAEIKPESYWSPNLMACLAMRHIHEIGAKATERHLWDPLAAAMASIESIGTLAIRRAKHDGLASEKILDLGKKAIDRKEWFATNVASRALNDLLVASVKARIDVDHVPARILDAIENLSIYAIENSLEWHALTGVFPAVPEYSIERVAWAALEFKNERHPDIETAQREGYAWETISSLLDVLTNIGTKAAQRKSSMLLTYIAQPMRRIALRLIDEESVALKHGFDPLVSKVVNALASMYIQAEDCPLVEEITDALTDIAFHSLDASKGEIASHIVEAISQMSMRTMSWDQYGYDSQRLAGRLGVIGSYAMNASNPDVATACANGLKQFDSAYRRRYRGSNDKRHFEEMQKLRDESGISLDDWAVGYKSIPQLALDQFKVLYENVRRKKLTRASKKRARRSTHQKRL